MALGFYNPHHAEPCVVKGDEEATAPETRRLGDMELCCFKLKVLGFPFLARGRLCFWFLVLGSWRRNPIFLPPSFCRKRLHPLLRVRGGGSADGARMPRLREPGVLGSWKKKIGWKTCDTLLWREPKRMPSGDSFFRREQTGQKTGSPFLFGGQGAVRRWMSSTRPLPP